LSDDDSRNVLEDGRLLTRTVETSLTDHSTGLLDSTVSSRTRRARQTARRTVAIGSAGTTGASHKTVTIRYSPEKCFSRYNPIPLTSANAHPESLLCARFFDEPIVARYCADYVERKSTN
jgi:hypothetical protein